MYPISFVSLGPGDPELLTIKALSRLQEADAIFLPFTQSKEGEEKSRSLDIVKAHDLKAHTHLYRLPMSRQREETFRVYDQIGAEAIQLQSEGQRVVIGVEGDIAVYGSIHYVLEQLESQGIATEQVPGISSISAAASLAKLSLISQQERLVVIPGQCDETEMLRLLNLNHVLVIMKLSACRDILTTFLQTHPHFRYDYFENVGTPAQVHLSDPTTILQRGLPYFSLIIIHCK
ncbi:MAG: precorrin-2 C(20)-methyltransferase [Bacteroidales bacterium]|nr:precorrin-2 C(20)-methyltransferase [Bacteroidales bacterium]